MAPSLSKSKQLLEKVFQYLNDRNIYPVENTYGYALYSGENNKSSYVVINIKNFIRPSIISKFTKYPITLFVHLYFIKFYFWYFGWDNWCTNTQLTEPEKVIVVGYFKNRFDKTFKVYELLYSIYIDLFN